MRPAIFRGRLWNFSALFLVAGTAGVQAQTTSTSSGSPGKIAFILPAILDQAVSVAPEALRPVLLSAIQPRWVSLNSSVATELSNLPNPTLASGLSYIWDAEAGAFRNVPQSFGPILTERAETVGKGRILFAVTNQNFSFDRLDDLDLRGFQVAYPLTLPLSSIVPGASSSVSVPGLIVANAYINIHVNETTMHVTYGITHWLDASYAFSIVDSSATVRGGAVLLQPSTGATLVNLPTQVVNLTSRGIGDGILRLKANLSSRPPKERTGENSLVPQSRRLKFAFGVDFRLPTGDEFNYHGAGAYGVKPFLVASINNKHLSPHINSSFLWNGKSFLASQYPTEARRLPGQLSWAAGFDSAVSSRVTLAFDVIDQMVISGQRSFLKPLSTGDTTYSQIYFEDRTRHELNGSAGIKAQIPSHLVVTANALFRLNDTGLRARLVPLFGISRQF